MRVMILIPGLPLNMSNVKGGVHSAVRNLLKGFTGHDIDVRVVSFSREVLADTKVVITDRIEIYYCYEGSYPYHSINYLLNGPNILRKHIKDFNPDVIHFQEGASFMLTRIKGLYHKKILQTIHGMSLAEAKRKKKIKDKITWYFNGVLQVATLPKNIIHLSNFSVNLFKKRKIINSAVIPNAIIPEYFELPSKLKTSNTLLYIGIIDNNKNLIFLLESLKVLISKNKFFTLNVLGDFINEVYKDLITGYIKRNKLEAFVNFQGWVNQATVLKFIEESDVLVVSSKHESLPMVIAESMAAGKVVVASNVGGIPEMIEDNVNGFLFKLDESNGLVKILEQLYNNDEKINAISIMARKNARERYHCENVAKKTMEFYEKIVCKNLQLADGNAGKK
ncbi:MAG: glycosyltransferase family 4 protein [Ferruginibacter sp.]